MTNKWLLVDRTQQTFLPPSVDELLPDDHLARFVVTVVDKLDLSPILDRYEKRGRGSTPYHPSLLLALLFYGYATGTCSSRAIERATYDDLAFRFIAAGHHPDHDTIASFRRRHLKALEKLFLRVLLVAREMDFLKVGTVSLDGTKIKANASKHKALSYKRAKELEKQYKEEIKRLMKMAEEADNDSVPDGMSIPEEIARREDRLEKIQEACRAIELRTKERDVEKYNKDVEKYVEKNEEYIEHLKDDSKRTPKKMPDPPEFPDSVPNDKDQENLTDPESRIMPDKGGFTQGYNAQIAVETESRLAVMSRLSQNTNDKEELLPAIEKLKGTDTMMPDNVLADAGYFSQENIDSVPPEVELYISPGREKHTRTLDERLCPPSEGEAAPDATPAEKMRHKLKTKKGRSLYRLRKMTVEPVIGIIKQAMRFRQFLLRGKEKVEGEWSLVCLAYNLKRMNTLRNMKAKT